MQTLIARVVHCLQCALGIVQQRERPVGRSVGARQLVMPFENAHPRAALSTGSAKAPPWLLTDDLIALGAPAISRDDRLRAFDRLRVPPSPRLSQATIIRLGQVVGAEQVIVGTFELDGTTLTVRARADSSRYRPHVRPRSSSAARSTDIFAHLRTRRAPAAARFDRSRRRRWSSGHPPLAAFEQFIKGVLAEHPATQIVVSQGSAPPRARLPPRAPRAVERLHRAGRASAGARRRPPGARRATGWRGRRGFSRGVSMVQPRAVRGSVQRVDRAESREAGSRRSSTTSASCSFAAPARRSGGRRSAYFREAVQLDANDADPDLSISAMRTGSSTTRRAPSPGCARPCAAIPPTMRRTTCWASRCRHRRTHRKGSGKRSSRSSSRRCTPSGKPKQPGTNACRAVSSA